MSPISSVNVQFSNESILIASIIIQVYVICPDRWVSVVDDFILFLTIFAEWKTNVPKLTAQLTKETS